MNWWKVAKLIVDDYAKGRKVSGEVKALLSMLLVKEIITEDEVKSILTWSEYDFL